MKKAVKELIPVADSVEMALNSLKDVAFLPETN